MFRAQAISNTISTTSKVKAEPCSLHDDSESTHNSLASRTSASSATAALSSSSSSPALSAFTANICQRTFGAQAARVSVGNDNRNDSEQNNDSKAGDEEDKDGDILEVRMVRNSTHQNSVNITDPNHRPSLRTRSRTTNISTTNNASTNSVPASDTANRSFGKLKRKISDDSDRDNSREENAGVVAADAQSAAEVRSSLRPRKKTNAVKSQSAAEATDSTEMKSEHQKTDQRMKQGDNNELHAHIPESLPLRFPEVRRIGPMFHAEHFAFDTAADEIFVPERRSHRVSVFRLSDGKWLRSIGQRGKKVSGYLYEPRGVLPLKDTVLVTSYNHRITVYEKYSGKYIREVCKKNVYKPHVLHLREDELWMMNSGLWSISVYTLSTFKLIKQFPLPGAGVCGDYGSFPCDVAFVNDRMYVTDFNRLSVVAMNISDGKVCFEWPIPSHKENGTVCGICAAADHLFVSVCDWHEGTARMEVYSLRETEADGKTPKKKFEVHFSHDNVSVSMEIRGSLRIFHYPLPRPLCRCVNTKVQCSGDHFSAIRFLENRLYLGFGGWIEVYTLDQWSPAFTRMFSTSYKI